MILSTVVAISIFSGCGIDNGTKETQAKAHLIRELKSVHDSEINKSKHFTNTDEKTNEDLTPDFIDPYTINNSIKDRGTIIP